MNPIPIQQKIEQILNALEKDNFESLVYYNEYMDAVWMYKLCHDEEKRALCMAILKSAIDLPDPVVCHEIDNTKTCAIHWTEGIIVLSGEFDSEKILKQVVDELKIAV